MIRTDELRLAYIEKNEAGEIMLSLPQSPDDLAQRRSSALMMIRQKNKFIPDILLELVLVELKEETPVKMLLRRPSGPPRFEIDVKVVDTEIDPSGTLARECWLLGDPIPARMAWDLKNLIPASEALAFLLRSELRVLKYAERRSSAKARTDPHLIPRSTIADVAWDLLQRSAWRYPPGEALVDLIRELLNLENPKPQHPRRPEAQESAAKILAGDPTIGVAELAKAVGVNKSSVSRWLKHPNFKAMVERAAQGKAS
jgi:hypothetical protein